MMLTSHLRLDYPDHDALEGSLLHLARAVQPAMTMAICRTHWSNHLLFVREDRIIDSTRRIKLNPRTSKIHRSGPMMRENCDGGKLPTMREIIWLALGAANNPIDANLIS